MRSPVGRLLVVFMTLLPLGIDSCAGSAPQGAVPLVVRQRDKVLDRLSLPQLQGLPQIEIATPQSRGAQVQKGPTVRSVLNAAGATGVERVRIEGRDPAQTLTDAELTDHVILSVTKRNTLKLTGTQLGTERWVRDVTTVVVNP
jgi:hypothetical protein